MSEAGLAAFAGLLRPWDPAARAPTPRSITAGETRPGNLTDDSVR